MTTPAAREDQSPLEAALADVHATLADLLVAADEQYAAVAAHDHDRLESVTRQQERLAARLARAEARRLQILNGASLADALATLPREDADRAETVRGAISTTIVDLKQRQAQTTDLLNRSITLGKQTLEFLQRLVVSPSPSYGARGVSAQRHSVLVDSRA